MYKINRIYLFIFVSFTILVLDWFQLLNFIKTPADLLIIPVKKEIFGSFQGIKNYAGFLTTYQQIYLFYQKKDELVRANEELKFKVDKLTAENEKLRAQLEAVFPPSVKFVPAQVISSSRFMEIDIGANQGVAKDQVVVAGETLIGKVKDVSAVRSKIMLVDDPDFKIAAITSRGSHGEVVGQTGETILLTKVLQKEPLFLEDGVVTAGGEFIPPNLLIGKIDFISSEERESYKQAKISPVLDFEKEKIVFVIVSL